jgi:anti-sigma factor RsiW
MTLNSSTANMPDELHAYLDGQLGPDEAAEVEARLAEDPEQLERFEAYARHKRLIGEAADAFAADSERGKMVNLRTVALERELASALAEQAAPARRRAWSWPLQTAAAVCLVSAGWFGHAEFGGGGGAPVLPAYVSEALGAHRAFADDLVRPVEFSSANAEEALTWISAKMGHPVRLPSLEPLGVDFVGVRLHGTREGPIAQFIYEDDAGNRMSLMLARHPEGAPAVGLAVASYEEGGRVGYWSDPRFDYALVAKASDVQIRAMAAELGGSTVF